MNAQTKHTPGPWVARVKGAQELAIDAPNGDPIIGHSRWKELATAYGCDDAMEDGSAVALANARLIAAAPELLDSLIDLVAMADFVAQREPGMDELKARIADARAAIAKAVTA